MNKSKSASRQKFKETAKETALKLSVYVLGFLSFCLCSAWLLYEIHAVIFKEEHIVPEASFVFYISCIIFSFMVIVGVQKDRLDYLTPYFITSIVLIGYLISVVMITVSKWSLIPNPVFTVCSSIGGLLVATLAAILLFHYMERLKEQLGIKSTWKRMKEGFTEDESDVEITTTE